MECMELVHSRHSVGESNYHIQLTPKYRQEVFREDVIKNATKRIIREICEMLKLKLYAIKFGPEHLHIFVRNCKNYAVPYLVKMFKGRTSRIIRKEYWDVVSQYLLGNAFWTGGYFYESIGRVTSESVKYYIERQQGKHWRPVDYELYIHRKYSSKTNNQKQLTLNDFAS